MTTWQIAFPGRGGKFLSLPLAVRAGLLHVCATLGWCAPGRVTLHGNLGRDGAVPPGGESGGSAPACDRAAVHATRRASARSGLSRAPGPARHRGRSCGDAHLVHQGGAPRRSPQKRRSRARLPAIPPAIPTEATAAPGALCARAVAAAAALAGPAPAASGPAEVPARAGLRPLPHFLQHGARRGPRGCGQTAPRRFPPYDETHADRRHPRGRNPRGGSGR